MPLYESLDHGRRRRQRRDRRRARRTAAARIKVTCATARVDKMPRPPRGKLPGAGGTDFNLSHNGGATQRPDVRATVDLDRRATPRATWADVRSCASRNEVRGRMDTQLGVLEPPSSTAASGTSPPTACTARPAGRARPRQLHRARPARSRGGLPPRPDTRPQFVTLPHKRDGSTSRPRAASTRSATSPSASATPTTTASPTARSAPLVDRGYRRPPSTSSSTTSPTSRPRRAQPSRSRSSATARRRCGSASTPFRRTSPPACASTPRSHRRTRTRCPRTTCSPRATATTSWVATAATSTRRRCRSSTRPHPRRRSPRRSRARRPTRTIRSRRPRTTVA